jgi:hypothetical protein
MNKKPQLRIFLFLFLCLFYVMDAGATSRALLVGVSQLAQQDQSLWLQAPRNDVLLMRTGLLRYGFTPANITTLADGVSGADLPDAPTIRRALSDLLQNSRSGDFVLLYFSEHGTRERDTSKVYQEPDGLAERFLARDVRRNGTMLVGALRDEEIGAWINAFLAKNVFVWTVFDTCSASSMTRIAVDDEKVANPSNDEVRFRSIRVDQLVGGQGGSNAQLGITAPPQTPGAPPARYVGFFASESHQTTPELNLPRHTQGAQPQGLLTWALTQTLAQKPKNYRELFNGMLALYPPVIQELQERFPQRELPSPVAEGNLDTQIFANSPEPASVLPAWGAQREGSQLRLSVGRLDGLDAPTTVWVTASLDNGSQRQAVASLTQIFDDSAILAIPSSLASMGKDAEWTISPTAAPQSLALRVATQQALPAGLSLPWPASIVRVSPNEGNTADVRWNNGNLELLNPDLKRLQSNANSIKANADVLMRLAQLKWVVQLSSRAQGGGVEGLDIKFQRWQGDRLAATLPLADLAQKPLTSIPGERNALVLRNGSGHSIDLVIMGISADGNLHMIYPATISETNRFEYGTRNSPALKQFDLPWFTPGSHLLLFASPSAPRSGPRLFGLSAPDSPDNTKVTLAAGRTRGVDMSTRGHIGIYVSWDKTPSSP